MNKHNPFVLMDDIRSSTERLANIKPYSQLRGGHEGEERCRTSSGSRRTSATTCTAACTRQVAADGSDGTPCPYGSTKDDANDAALKQKADDFVKGAVTTIMSTTAWKTGRSAIFIVTDENDFTGEKTTDGWESAEGCCDSPNLGKGTPFLGSTARPTATSGRAASTAAARSPRS